MDLIQLGAAINVGEENREVLPVLGCLVRRSFVHGVFFTESDQALLLDDVGANI
jgi:hypothetical protein